MFKKRLQKSFKFSGIGTHSGVFANVIVEPAPLGNGISFIRSDLDNSVIKASFENVINTNASTVIGNNDGAVVRTIEHLMSALTCFGVFDAYIYIDSDEMPILDGSSSEFVKLINDAGVVQTDKLQEYCHVTNEFTVFDDKGAFIKLSPANEFSVDINLQCGALNQSLSLNINNSLYCDKIANARTFGFLKDREKLQNLGLIKGVSFENSLILDASANPINKSGLRFKDEQIHHKVLDLVGDFGLIGMPIVCLVSGTPSHTLNNLALKKLLTFEQKYAMVKTKMDEVSNRQVLDSSLDSFVQYL